MITESDQLASAIDYAARARPELRDERAELLRYIIDLGIQAMDAEILAGIESRKKAITQAAGSLTDIWPENWRELIRSEWPE